MLTGLMREGKLRRSARGRSPRLTSWKRNGSPSGRGLARFRTEQPPYSILYRSIEREVLPTCQRYGMGVMAWSPLAKGMLTGKYRKGGQQPDTLRAKYFPSGAVGGSGLLATLAHADLGAPPTYGRACGCLTRNFIHRATTPFGRR